MIPLTASELVVWYLLTSLYRNPDSPFYMESPECSPLDMEQWGIEKLT